MANNLCIFRCNACGHLLEAIESGKEQLVCSGESFAKTCRKTDAQAICCGKPMELLIPNTVEASTEKHIPVAELGADGSLVVKIGSVTHPMTAEHFIQWISVVSGNRVQRVTLAPGDAPEATFCACGADEVDMYAYCNLHGLWKGTIKK